MDENRSNEWYSTSVYDWYAPNFDRSASPAAIAAPVDVPKAKKARGGKKRRVRTGFLIALIVVCVLALVTASALIFSGGLSLGDSYLSQNPVESPAIPDTNMPADEFFSRYFPDFDRLFPDFEGEVIIPGAEASPALPEGDTAPDSGEEPALPDSGEDMPEDFRDYLEGYYTSADTILPSSITRTQPTGDFTIEFESTQGLQELSLQDLYSTCSPYVVGIKTMYDNKPGYGWGTGLIIDVSGYVVTNAHVLSEGSSCSVVLFNGKECEAMLVGEDSETDLAVLKIDAKGLVAAPFASSDDIKVGDEVVAIGNPLAMEFSGTFTNGIISGINRSVTYSGTNMPLIQTNTALNEGNSGGPLINMYGQVIGITNMKMSNQFGVTIEGIAFAIPSTVVKTVVDSIIANGKVMGRPGIGITCGSVPQTATEEYGLPQGLYVIEVSEESDAKAKGILPGDVITHINGQQVLTTDDVLTIRDQHKIGDILHFTIYRNGETLELDVEIYDQGNIY